MYDDNMEKKITRKNEISRKFLEFFSVTILNLKPQQKKRKNSTKAIRFFGNLKIFFHNQKQEKVCGKER
jgi:hypothetical protein